MHNWHPLDGPVGERLDVAAVRLEHAVELLHDPPQMVAPDNPGGILVRLHGKRAQKVPPDHLLPLRRIDLHGGHACDLEGIGPGHFRGRGDPDVAEDDLQIGLPCLPSPAQDLSGSVSALGLGAEVHGDGPSAGLLRHEVEEGVPFAGQPSVRPGSCNQPAVLHGGDLVHEQRAVRAPVADNDLDRARHMPARLLRALRMLDPNVRLPLFGRELGPLPPSVATDGHGPGPEAGLQYAEEAGVGDPAVRPFDADGYGAVLLESERD